MNNYKAEYYEHYHDNGDDMPPTIEPAIYCNKTNTYITGFKTLKEAEKRATELNNID